MQLIEQSQSITIRIGPFVDEDDGKTEETALTIAQADIRLTKNGGDFAQSNDSGGATHDEFGWYYLTLDATDTGTLGRLLVNVRGTGALRVWREFMVVPENVWDALVGGTDYLQVDVVEILAAAANKIADHTIRRTFQNACDSAFGDTKTFRSMLGAMAKLVNKVAPNGANIEIFEDDDTTVLGTQTPTTDSGADPITALDTV